MSQFKLEIVTPERKFFEGEVEMVITKSITGDLAILKDHIPLVTPLDISIITLKIDENTSKQASISAGYMEVSKEGTTIIVDSAEWPDEIDLDRVAKARERAEKRIQNKEENTDVTRAELALKRSINRLHLKE